MISIRLDHYEQEATMTVIAMTREIGSHGTAAGVPARLGLSTYRLLAAYRTLARLNAGLAEVTRPSMSPLLPGKPPAATADIACKAVAAHAGDCSFTFSAVRSRNIPGPHSHWSAERRRTVPLKIHGVNPNSK